jgi:ribosomal-protein-alanine N-acetyltransferase
MEDFLITTERITIRHLALADLEDFYSYRSDPEVALYQGFDAMSRQQAHAFIEENSTKRFGSPGVWVQFAIASNETGKVIGDCAIKFDKNDNRLAEIGMTISPLQQKRGYAKEALTAILHFLFSRKDFHRVTEIVDVENAASIQLLKSLGFRNEGHFVENIFFNGKWGSEYQYAILKSEWITLAGL